MNHIGTAMYSPEDNKLRLYPFHRLEPEVYARVKAAGFIWAPKQELFVAPMWTPYREDLLLELAGEIDDEDKSLVDRAEQRAERFEDYGDNRKRHAEAAHKAVHAIADNIPLGQPIPVGHHSERHARKDAEKIENGMRRAIMMWDQAQYWKSRAAGAIRNAKYKERPDVWARRIKGLEAERRKVERNLADAQMCIDFWSQPEITREAAILFCNLHDHTYKSYPLSEYPRQAPASQYEGDIGLWSALGGSDGPDHAIITVQQAAEISLRVHNRSKVSVERWIAHYNNRLEYERAMLAEDGGLPAEKFDIQPGGQVSTGREWVTVLRVNRKDGAICSVSTTRRYVPVIGIEEVRDYRAPTAEDVAKVEAVKKLAPLTNYPSEGGVEMTKAEWDKKWRDYKGTRTAPASEKFAVHRYRVAVHHGSLKPVFITNAKRVDPPAAELITAAPEPPTFVNQPATDPQAEAERPDREAEAAPFDALRETIKTGVKVVTAPQLFPTPPALAARMVELAEIPTADPDFRLLEPSAGTLSASGRRRPGRRSRWWRRRGWSSKVFSPPPPAARSRPPLSSPPQSFRCWPRW